MNSRSSKPQPTLVDSATAATYDGRGQRVSKTVDGVTTHFIYGLNGELMGEYTADGNSSKEYVYLNGQPIAAVIAETQAATPEDFWMDTDFENPWSGITHTGEWWYGSSPENHIHGHHRSTGAGTYRFTPALTAGTYEVYVWWVDVTIRGGATSVPYSINHNGSIDIEYRNQTSGGGQWQLLGTFEFHGRGAEYVEVDAVNGITTADAVRFVQIPAGEETSVETFYIHTDHLGAPRAMSDELQTVVWRWDSAPFGNSPVDEDPDGDGTAVTLNLRFPGQYFHAESGLHYNYFRTYDPQVGRYIESDPIGLDGGLNTFGYVMANPLASTDPYGLVIWKGQVFAMDASFVRWFGGAFYIYTLTSECVDGKQARVRVHAKGIGNTFGIKLGIGGGSVTFDDGKSNVDPDGFNGGWVVFTAGVSGGGGYGYSKARLGDAIQIDGAGAIGGASAGVAEFAGTSEVVNITWLRQGECCE